MLLTVSALVFSMVMPVLWQSILLQTLTWFGLVMAMVSEVLRLSTGEREELAAHVCRIGRTSGVVVISTGAESSHTAERLSRQAEAAGADALMAIPPVSIALGDDELLRYYERILRSVEIPVIVQDASGYVGQPMSIELQARIFQEFGYVMVPAV